MEILYLNTSVPNYVVDGLLHGLRSLSGISVVDIPRMDYMYTNASSKALSKTGTRGNTLYGLLPEWLDNEANRTFWLNELDKYDFIILTDIVHQCDMFHFIYNHMSPLKRGRLCVVDGYDMAALFPFFNNLFNLKVRPWSYFYKIRNTLYFKREYVNTGELYGISYEKRPSLNRIFSKLLNKPEKLFPISMSIPEEHIEVIPFREKVKDFVNYNIDDDLNDLFPEAPLVEIGKWQPAFKNQQDYFKEISMSRYGVTAKRAGWDCLRHYEYAAKGAILCFKELHRKNTLCAPFGLNDTNCIQYNNKQDLLKKIRMKSTAELEAIQEKQYAWVNNFTTRKVALRFIDQLCAIK